MRVARRAVEDGHRWLVDLDLDRFFDRVRRFLEAGIVDGGIASASEQGTPQGAPLPPILSNIMLDDLDRELWSRRLRFVRHAGDVRIFVRSRRAAQSALGSVTKVVEGRLHLKVNRVKPKVVAASVMTMLAFGFSFARGGEVRIRVDPKTIDRPKFRVKELTSRRWSIAMDERIAVINRYVTDGWATPGWRTLRRCSRAGQVVRPKDAPDPLGGMETLVGEIPEPEGSGHR